MVMEFCRFFFQTLQKEITQNKGDVTLLLKAGNDLLEGREGAAGSDEIQASIKSLLWDWYSCPVSLGAASC